MSLPRWSDQRVEQLVGGLLRVGVLVAALVVAAGGVEYLRREGHRTHDYRVFASEPRDLRGVAGILHDVATGSSAGIIQLGLLLLMATPVARVLLSVIAFALQRDRLYVGVTLVVLSVLLYSLLASG